jgi:hypothetical protein
MEDRSTVRIFLDDEPKPLGEYAAPVHFELDTTRLVDGNHCLRIVSRDPAARKASARYLSRCATARPLPWKASATTTWWTAYCP